MQKLTIEDILKATGGELLCGSEDTVICDITTDSRKASQGMLFVPIVGEKFDAHNFIASSLEAGAAAAITHKDIDAVQGKSIVKVKDTFTALADIARYYKAKYNLPTVAVTGSVGKTTTKDMLHSVLSQKYNTLKTEGNFNNEIGLPLTVFRLQAEHEAAVLEMGMSHFGEIEKLSSVANPDVAVITNIGMSHIENLGSQEGIFKAKTECLKYFDEHNVLIVNGDDKFLSTTKGKGNYKVVYYGITNPQNDVYAKDIVNLGARGTEFIAVADGEEYKVKVNVAGEHNVYNALAAICVGREFGVSKEGILKGIEGFELTAMRMSVEDINGITVVNDCYNASPDSMRAALKVLASFEDKRKIAILGDMLEMGNFAPDAHKGVGEAAFQCADIVITAGENAHYISQKASEMGTKEVYSFNTTEEAKEFVKGFVKCGDAVLIKASRGMHFEEIYNTIVEK